MFRLEKQELLAILVVVLLVVAAVVGLTLARGAREPGVPVGPAVNTGGPGIVENSGGDSATITVHVAGEVVAPGVYELPLGARVDDAVRLAQPTSQADPNALNLAARLRDGDKIVVPARRSAVLASPGGEAGEIASGGPSEPASAGGLIDINSATQAELETLPGIGPARAKSIIDYRNTHRFRRIEDIMNVSGIGPGIFANIRDKIVVY
jgi:competence protein ComEA